MYCEMCGKREAECTHHLVFGTGLRSLADADELTIRLCNSCHNLGGGTRQIHENMAAERLSKMLGQALYENAQIGSDEDREKARTLFIKRYGRSYL